MLRAPIPAKRKTGEPLEVTDYSTRTLLIVGAGVYYSAQRVELPLHEVDSAGKKLLSILSPKARSSARVRLSGAQ